MLRKYLGVLAILARCLSALLGLLCPLWRRQVVKYQVQRLE